MAKKATTAKRKRAAGTAAHIEEQMTAMEREWLTPERSPLPFQVTCDSVITPTWDTDKPPLEQYMWRGNVLKIANAVLAAHHRLLVPVRGDCIAFATCEISQRLKEPVRIWYTKRHEALIVASTREDGEEEDRETERDDVVGAPEHVRICAQPDPVTERERLCRKLARCADIVHMDRLQMLGDAAEVWADGGEDSRETESDSGD